MILSNTDEYGVKMMYQGECGTRQSAARLFTNTALLCYQSSKAKALKARERKCHTGGGRSEGYGECGGIKAVSGKKVLAWTGWHNWSTWCNRVCDPLTRLQSGDIQWRINYPDCHQVMTPLTPRRHPHHHPALCRYWGQSSRSRYLCVACVVLHVSSSMCRPSVSSFIYRPPCVVLHVSFSMCRPPYAVLHVSSSMCRPSVSSFIYRPPCVVLRVSFSMCRPSCAVLHVSFFMCRPSCVIVLLVSSFTI
ncbi:hypothetical protein J6590_029178 [Homalodisca vitripennis]|nr:hypothetical protein J6590_029178 [Homalodisca vitripennis]